MSENFEELRAEEWLEGRGYVDICDLSREGKDPPDFVIGDSIAVEVRRLTDASATKGKGRGIDKPLEKIVGEILEEAGKPLGGHDVFVRCGFLGCDLPPSKVTRRQVKQAIGEYVRILGAAFSRSGGNPVTKRTRLECGKFIFDFWSRPASMAGKFKLEQATWAMGGLVGAGLVGDINRCILEKTDKIGGKFNCYPEWWLVLVDREFLTAPEWDRDEWQQIRNGLVDVDPWSRVVVVGDWGGGLGHTDLIGQSTRD